MRCPYCLEPLPTDGTCPNCGGTLPTGSVAEPTSGSLWKAIVKRGAAVLTLITPLLFLLPLGQWLEPAVEGVFRAIRSPSRPDRILISKRTLLEGVIPPKPIDLSSLDPDALGYEGRLVLFDILISVEGRATLHGMVVGAATEPLLEAIAGWRFEPASDREKRPIASVSRATLDRREEGELTLLITGVDGAPWEVGGIRRLRERKPGEGSSSD